MMMKLSPEIGQLEATLQETSSRPAPACPVYRKKLVVIMTVGICFLVPLDNPFSTAAVVKERLL